MHHSDWNESIRVFWGMFLFRNRKMVQRRNSHIGSGMTPEIGRSFRKVASPF